MSIETNKDLYYRSVPRIPGAEGKYLIDMAILSSNGNELLITAVGMRPWGKFTSLLFDKKPLIEFLHEIDKYVLASTSNYNSHYLVYEYKDIYVLQRILASCYVPLIVYEAIIKRSVRFKNYVFARRIVKSWAYLYQVIATKSIKAKGIFDEEKRSLFEGKLYYGDGRPYCVSCPLVSHCVYRDSDSCYFPLVRDPHRVDEVCDETFKDLLFALVELNVKSLDCLFGLDKKAKIF